MLSFVSSKLQFPPFVPYTCHFCKSSTFNYNKLVFDYKSSLKYIIKIWNYFTKASHTFAVVMTVFFEYHGNSVKEEIMDNALAENKLLILYTLNQSKLILTKTQFSNIILECMYINYFELQQYIEELIKTGLVLLDVVHDKEAVVISDQGKSVLGMFQDRIPDRKKKVIDTYLTENINHLIRETTITHEISEGPHGAFQVILSAFENKDELIRISMIVPTKETAEKSVQTWKKESTKIYELLYKELSKKGQ